MINLLILKLKKILLLFLKEIAQSFVFLLFFFLFGCALLDIFKVCQFSQTDKCLPSVLCVYMEN